MLVVHFVLKAFRVYIEGKHIRVMIDNTTAITTLAHRAEVTRHFVTI